MDSSIYQGTHTRNEYDVFGTHVSVFRGNETRTPQVSGSVEYKPPNYKYAVYYRFDPSILHITYPFNFPSIT